jgi:hypothetical protein
MVGRGIKRPGHEFDHSPSSTAKVKKVWSYASNPQVPVHGNGYVSFIF